MLQRTRFKIIIYALFFSLAIILLSFWIYFAVAQARDYQRLADLKIWQDVLNRHYMNYGTYQKNNCENGKLLSACWEDYSGRFRINNINDPINSGNYRYIVGGLGVDDYQINFSLEAGIGGLSRGNYILTKNGVKID